MMRNPSRVPGWCAGCGIAAGAATFHHPVAAALDVVRGGFAEPYGKTRLGDRGSASVELLQRAVYGRGDALHPMRGAVKKFQRGFGGFETLFKSFVGVMLGNVQGQALSFLAEWIQERRAVVAGRAEFQAEGVKFVVPIVIPCIILFVPKRR